MSTETVRARQRLSTALSITAVALGVLCVVLVFLGGQVAVAAGSAAVALTALAGLADARNRHAPAAFLVCLGLIVVALVASWVRQ
jgi:hypothetical protein